ncbi:hypothetical protein JRO89_XS13G0052800 [Xanthoceras sorbifolium]|uniref:DOG1 domain-containing protein n=1 Tax=Xanthoceras sorbifolium TaxID=99658 RepID=A0ABQ8H6Q3_9ROSI|nr:hypothetical protein JRO89_XS13G0052800 [Xanthoceras sorbifolium]
MPKPFSSLFSRSKKPLPGPSQTLSFTEYYTNWFNTLNNTLLPLIHQSLSSSSSSTPTLLCSHVDILLQHLLSYYDTLDLAASQEHLPQLLFPSWRNSLEIPFLFLGDLHPYLFTNLLRSFLDQEEDDDDDTAEDDDEFLDIHRPWQVVMAWKNVSKSLMAHVEQIECGLRLMVPALTNRIKKVQGGFVGRIAENWVGFYEGKREGIKSVIEEAMKEEMVEMVTVFMDANRLRKSVITEIVSALTVYQAALFLEALAQFLVGFRDPDLIAEFKRTKELPITGGFHLGF